MRLPDCDCSRDLAAIHTQNENKTKPNEALTYIDIGIDIDIDIDLDIDIDIGIDIGSSST